MRQLFELCGEDRDIRFSPFVWPVRMALKHKGLDFEGIPTRFLEKEGYEASGSKAVPVLKDGDTYVSDSFEIAKYLDETYPDNPLLGDDVGFGLTRFMQSWAMNTVMMKLFPMTALDVYECLDAENAAYFRKTREPRLGGLTLEDAKEAAMSKFADFQAGFAPLSSCLKGQDFLCGAAPAWADYVLFGVLQWVRTVAEYDPVAGLEEIIAWRERMLDLYDGYARSSKCVHPE